MRALCPLVARGTAGHALLTKRDARAAWCWIAVCWLFPLAGPALYYVFGVNRVRTHAKRFAIDRSGRHIGSVHSADISNASSEHEPKPSWLEEFARTSDVLTSSPQPGHYPGHPLQNSDEAYPRSRTCGAEGRNW